LRVPSDHVIRTIHYLVRLAVVQHVLESGAIVYSVKVSILHTIPVLHDIVNLVHTDKVDGVESLIENVCEVCGTWLHFHSALCYLSHIAADSAKPIFDRIRSPIDSRALEILHKLSTGHQPSVALTVLHAAVIVDS